ncbi:hypothetical protein [Thermosyntropha sp.]|uniref:hypothetical protein n=1 Tax=Thermosyntropha sp. TaxID=2740820 RepID=UPI0025FF1BAA|nr:hypothetical protein [Thermosyntropha sp.]MBO8159978.1 hypothetical protein [Thermosyntropha sp.]
MLEVLKFTAEDRARIVEAFIGEYASGKSEIAINRAVEIKRKGRTVTIVDLDTVEPFYTLRPLKNRLQELGLNVISYSKSDTFGLGETGAMLNPQAKWALMNEGDIILDVGYGVYGAQTLNLVEGAYESPYLRIIAVVNYTRPMTNSLSRIKEYIKELGRVDAIVANTHLGDDTTPDLIRKGNKVIIKAAIELGLPVDYMAVDKKFFEIEDFSDLGVKVKFIERYMPAAMW